MINVRSSEEKLGTGRTYIERAQALAFSEYSTSLGVAPTAEQITSSSKLQHTLTDLLHHRRLATILDTATSAAKSRLNSLSVPVPRLRLVTWTVKMVPIG